MSTLLPIQTQPFTLYGNGVVIGATSLTLTSFNDINGIAIPFQGTTMTGTIEPGNGSNEEQIIFTGLTTNTNGTVTLTGVSSVAFASPYTLTSGVVKSHFGNTTFTLSDTAYLYSQFASLGANNTFTGTDTFSVSPFIPTVASSATGQAASVGYVNSVAISGSPKASNTVFGITELTVAPATASVPLAVGDNDPRMSYVTASESLALTGDGGTPSNLNTYVTQQGLQNGSEFFATSTGSSTAFAISYFPTPSGYVTGELIKFKANVSNGTPVTINKNSLGAKSLYKMNSSGTTPLAVADIGTNQVCIAEFDGIGYQLINLPLSISNPPLGLYKNGLTTHDISTTTPTVIAHGLGVVPKFVRMVSNWAGSTSQLLQSVGTYNGTTTVSTTFYQVSGGNAVTGSNNFVDFSLQGTTYETATIAIDATNITLTWTKTSAPTGTIQLMWEAQA